MKNKHSLALAGGAVLVLALLSYPRWSGWLRSEPPASGTDTVPCINGSLPIPEQYHIHPELRMVIGGQEVPLPADIGLKPGCERVLHTHDADGVIHIEPNFQREFRLKEFFAVWGEPFGPDRLLDRQGEVRMTVNGEPNSEYGELVLKDKQKIVLELR